jgi:NADP-reducing hydrogenase subunit HndC
MKIHRSMVLVSGDALSLERGARAVHARLLREVERLGLADEVAVALIDDVGRHDVLPVVLVYPEAVIYGPVTPEAVPHLVEEHLYKGRVVEALRAPVKELSGRIAWLAERAGTLPAEQRILLERAGQIDPDEIEDYILHDGYTVLGRVLAEMTPEQVIATVTDAGLRGRGGAGFPTGRKLQFVAQASGDRKYVVCNADESEPGTFKDRLLMEADPHAVLEAMALVGYATGAHTGYIYVRGEYRLAQARLARAIEQARGLGLLGRDLFGSGFDFDVHVHAGAGAYICGEETALLESLEGRRGEPRSRPPYPVTHGLWGQPTTVINVETLANVVPILRHGAAWYRGFGTASSPGTKLYTVLGNVNVTGLIEVPMGITLREVIAIYARGMKNGARFKLAQTGGSSGSVFPASLQDTPMDYDSLAKAGVALGSGALLICDEHTCVVDLALVLLNFFRHESCGKCTPCRVGTERAYQVLASIAAGEGTAAHLDELAQLADSLERLSFCGLGQTAATPLKDVLKHFRDEVEAHIFQRVCPAGVCSLQPAALAHTEAGTGDYAAPASAA